MTRGHLTSGPRTTHLAKPVEATRAPGGSIANDQVFYVGDGGDAGAGGIDRLTAYPASGLH